MTEMLTLLLTDIEGSTERWERAPGAMRPALARHDEMLRRTIDEYAGRVIKSTGDGLWGLFTDSTQAIDAAVEAQRGIESTDWGEIGPLRVRIAIHATRSSEVEERDGDLHGSAMNRCARINELAHGGQILCSAAAIQLARDTGRPWSPRPLGTHRLRDLREPETLYQVVHPDLQHDFPALASLDAFPHNLPVQRTSFVGRESEVLALVDHLTSARLVTLTGPGGAGKTRLASAVAAEFVDVFPDGVWLVELAALREPGLLAATFASTLHLREQPGRPLEQTLLEHLSDRHLLLVVDNCEHLVRECAVLADRILDACSRVHLLVTSRERLGVAGEVVRHVTPLGIPSEEQPDDPDAESVRLFVDRATAVAPGLVLDDDARRTIGRICRRLDGIPLALELAAARMTVLAPHELEARLNDRFRLLAGGGRTALPQHQTLRATFEWSHDLLTHDEQVLFRRMGVFSSAAPLHTLERVIGGDDLPSSGLLDHLTGLVEKSLVTAERSSSATLFGMLETVREYAHERLVEAGEADDFHTRHATWLLEATDSVRARAQHSPFTGVETLGASMAEVRAALAWLEDEDPVAALQLTAELSVVWFTRGWLTEGRDRLARLLALAGDDANPGLRARAWTGLASLAVSQGDFDEAERWAQEVENRGGEYSTRVICLWVLGIVAWVRGDLATAIIRHEEGIELARRLEFPNGERTHLNALARVHRSQGDLDRAESLDKEALAAARRHSDESAAAPCLDGLARVAYLRGDLDRARTLAEEARGGYLLADYVEGVASSLTVSAAVELADGNMAAARAHLADGLRRYEQIGHRAGMANALEVAAALSLREGGPETAAQLVGAVQVIRESLGEQPTGDELLMGEDLLPALRNVLGDTTDALVLSGRSLTKIDEAVAIAMDVV